MKIPFNEPVIIGKEKKYIQQVLKKKHLSGDGEFTQRCTKLMEQTFGAPKILLTTSCTHALDLASLLIDLKEGDEVIVPSYTFPSTVNSFMLRGAKPVFIDIREDTFNIDEEQIVGRITSKTKAIFPVHYAGIGCDMDTINNIARKYDLFVVEDAAQGVNAKFKDRYLGTIGSLGAYSFHETKNYVCGEGGAIVINDKKFIERAEILREKGTNRSKFFRGEVDKYTWVDIGSSFLPSEILAAYLYAQLENMDKILNKRKKIYEYYAENLEELAIQNKIRLPVIPSDCTPNYHMFFIILPIEAQRDKLMNYLKQKGIMAIFHYIPLHLSPMGEKNGYKKGDLPITEALSSRLLRLPFYYNLSRQNQNYIIKEIKDFFRDH